MPAGLRHALPQRRTPPASSTRQRRSWPNAGRLPAVGLEDAVPPALAFVHQRRSPLTAGSIWRRCELRLAALDPITPLSRRGRMALGAACAGLVIAAPRGRTADVDLTVSPTRCTLIDGELDVVTRRGCRRTQEIRDCWSRSVALERLKRCRRPPRQGRPHRGASMDHERPPPLQRSSARPSSGPDATSRMLDRPIRSIGACAS